jgi:hypothetical protein
MNHRQSIDLKVQWLRRREDALTLLDMERI